jgi:hypothetical protein
MSRQPGDIFRVPAATANVIAIAKAAQQAAAERTPAAAGESMGTDRSRHVARASLKRRGKLLWPFLLVIAVALFPGLALAALSLSTHGDRQLAYLDPGSGSFLIQAVIASIAGAAVTLRLYWGKIKSFLGGAVPEIEEDASEGGDRDDG